MEIKTRLVTITPEMAERCLAKNENNRNIRQRHVDRLAEDIKSGNWYVTHQGIAFDEDGKLLDGQHRLLAIVKAGIPVQMMMTTGLKRDDVMSAIDVGSTRDIGDSLRLKHNDTIFNSATIALAKYVEYHRSHKTMTLSQVEKAVINNYDLFDFARRVKHMTQGYMPTSARTALVAARVYGVPEETLAAFSRLAFCNEVDMNISPQTNKIILDYAKSIELKGYSSNVMRGMQFNLTKSAIYTYVKGLKRLYKNGDGLYPIHYDENYAIVKG